jgi:hypothetical protein
MLVDVKYKEFLAEPKEIGLKVCNISEPQPLPPIEKILEKGRTELPIYGIYCWGIDYPQYRDAICGIGFTQMRAPAMTDEAFAQIIRDGIDFFPTFGIHRNRFASDEEFVEGNIENDLNFLRRYGPNGSYFKEHPDAPYRPVTAVELYNEPNFGYMISDSAPREEKVRLYTMLQVAAYPRIKAEFPTVTVVGFGAGGASAADVGFIADCMKYDKRIYDTMDVLSTHPYADWSPFAYAGWLKYSVTSCYNEIRELLRAGGKEEMPIWYTELGWFLRPECGGFYDTCHKGYDQLAQAAFTVQMYALGLRLGIDRITNMYIMDTDNCNPGFVNRDGSFRVSAEATKTMISLMPHPRLTAAVLDGADNCYAYRIESQPGGEEILMVFSAVERKSVTVPWDGERALLTDMLGKTKEVTAEGGNLTLDVGACPVYVRHIG